MTQKSARLSRGEIFRQETLAFENLPGQSKLFADFQKKSPNVERFYPEINTPLEIFAEDVLSNYKVDRAALCDILAETNKSFGARSKTFANIESLRTKDCLAIVTGQQAGLFSGALYTIYKALSAVKLAADLKKQYIKAVPVFWIAEEDHDFDEVKKTFNLEKEGKLVASENKPESYRENSPVGRIELDETIKETIADLFGRLAHTEFTEKTRKLIESAYQPGKSYSRAFAEFLTEIFADHGLIALSPLNPDLKKLCAPVFAEAVEKSEAIAAALSERNEELEKENYQPQVLVTKDFFPFFFQNENGARQALRRDPNDGKIKVQKSKREFETARLTEIAERSPQNLSPNALLRPVVQDYLLPTLTYFGGAAEVAYFAQNSAIYKILNRPITPIRHRAGFTVVERKHARSLEKYALSFNELFDGEEEVWARVVEKHLDRKTAQTFTEVERGIGEQLKRLDESLSHSEPTLAANLITRKKKIFWHLAALRKKYHRSETLKNEVAHRRIESLFGALLPHNALQERTLNVTTFLNLYGENFIEWIYETVETDEKNHQILYL